VIDYAENERRMFESEARYMEGIKARFGDDMNERVLNLMAGLYRAGWRDCRVEVMSDET
jgi:hypothetical protein